MCSLRTSSLSQQPSNILRGWCSVKIVEIKEFGQDRYGRTLGVVFVNGKKVNLEMVEVGYAEVYWGTPATGFDSAPWWKEEARAAKIGMWTQGDKYMSPREWRKANN